MSVLAAFMVPHPPMIVPEVGRGSEKQVEATRAAYLRVAEEISELKPETVIISSPHAAMYADYFHLSPGTEAEGSFAQFRAPEVRFQPFKDVKSDYMKAILRHHDMLRATGEAFGSRDALDKFVAEWKKFWLRM